MTVEVIELVGDPLLNKKITSSSCNLFNIYIIVIIFNLKIFVLEYILS